MDTIQKRLKVARKAKGLTQKEVAEILGVTQPAYQKFERPEPPDMRVSTLLKLCNVLEVSADWLIGVDEQTVAVKGVLIPGKAAKAKTLPKAAKVKRAGE